MAALCMTRPDPGVYVALGLTASDTVIGISHLLHTERLTASDQYSMAWLAQLLGLPEDPISLATGLTGSDREAQFALIEVLGERRVADATARHYAAILKRVLAEPDLPLSVTDRESLTRLSDFAALLGDSMLSRTSTPFLL